MTTALNAKPGSKIRWNQEARALVIDAVPALPTEHPDK